MNKMVDLPLAVPMYSTYNFQGPCIAVTAENPSIRNWILNEVCILACNRSFLTGRTSPDVFVVKSSWKDNPYLEKIEYTLRFSDGYINPVIHNLLDHGYYVCFDNMDDFYIKGKSWYHKRHLAHDGMICGYNRQDKTYCIYAYDSNWIYRKFWTPQRCFDRSREASQKNGGCGEIYGVRAKPDQVELSPKTVYKNMQEYLDSSFEQYPTDGEGIVYGIIVQEYLAIYIGKLYDGSVPYERTDSRVLRLLWEHKKVMLERMIATEKELSFETGFAEKYKKVVADADWLRMLYASHHIRRRDEILPKIQNGILKLKEDEEKILTGFVNCLGERIQ